MAPEQADTREQAPDTRWDVYALGAMLHETVQRLDEAAGAGRGHAPAGLNMAP
jgi:hypothetical protein